MQDEYIKISLLELIRCISLSAGKKEVITDKLITLFSNAKTAEIILPIDSEEAKYILKYNQRIDIYNYVTIESLSSAFTRLYFGKNNKELLKRMEQYYREYCENIKSDVDNKYLKEIIINDKEAFDTIKKFSTYKEYEIGLVGKNIKMKKLVNKTKKNQGIQGKPIID